MRGSSSDCTLLIGVFAFVRYAISLAHETKPVHLVQLAVLDGVCTMLLLLNLVHTTQIGRNFASSYIAHLFVITS